MKHFVAYLRVSTEKQGEHGPRAEGVAAEEWGRPGCVKLQNCRNIKEVIEGVKAKGYRAHHPFCRDCRILDGVEPKDKGSHVISPAWRPDGIRNVK
jgi:hypothetical protein